MAHFVAGSACWKGVGFRRFGFLFLTPPCYRTEPTCSCSARQPVFRRTWTGAVRNRPPVSWRLDSAGLDLRSAPAKSELRDRWIAAKSMPRPLKSRVFTAGMVEFSRWAVSRVLRSWRSQRVSTCLYFGESPTIALRTVRTTSARIRDSSCNSRAEGTVSRSTSALQDRLGPFRRYDSNA